MSSWEKSLSDPFKKGQRDKVGKSGEGQAEERCREPGIGVTIRSQTHGSKDHQLCDFGKVVNLSVPQSPHL